jgi:outer membrane protein assembly factor BamE (lipoprotein component of BamABCDE complex)
MKALAFLVAAALLTLGSGEGIAQTTSESRVAKLEETVRLLEQRLAALEKQLRTTATPPAAAPANAIWRKLRNGMSESEVEQLLGSPSKVDNFGTFFVWYYDFPSGGHVKFGRSRTVDGWSEP